MLEGKIEQDLKTAMLARDSEKTEVLRGLKSAILYYKVANKKREETLDDSEVISIFSKEAKKRQESAELYIQGKDEARANKELSEKAIIDQYLPKKMSIDDLTTLVEKVMTDNPEANMGQIISAVREQTQGSADGGDIARIVKEKLL